MLTLEALITYAEHEDHGVGHSEESDLEWKNPSSVGLGTKDGVIGGGVNSIQVQVDVPIKLCLESMSPNVGYLPQGTRC